MDLQDARERAKAVWGAGDYAPIGRQLEPASQQLVETLGIGPEHHVLDVAAGDGNASLAAARRGAAVTATDFSPVMIQHGRGRSDAADLPIAWEEADATDLPFADDTFDRVISVFGVIFAPDHARAAAEMTRVTRPGGWIGLTAWDPDGYTGRMLEIVRRSGPQPPPGTPDSLDWGRPEHVESLVAPLGWAIEVRPRMLTFTYPSWDAWRAANEAHGMAVVAKGAMSADAYEAMVRDLRALTEEHRHSDGGAIAYDAAYLEITVSER